MAKFLATLTFLLIASPAAQALQTVRISLLSLFKPDAIEVRVAAGEAAIDAAGLSSEHHVTHSESIRIRVSGGRLSVARVNLHSSNQPVVLNSLRITPVGSSTLELILPGRIKRIVRGTLTVDSVTEERGRLRIVLTTGREDAVASVVAAETSERSVEALKALAVVVRTFMISHEDRHASEGFDFCDTTHCQLYRGEQDLMDARSARTVFDAVAATAGEFLSYGGLAIEGHYSAGCGGISVTPSMVWGGSERYPYKQITCRWCRASRFARWARSAGVSNILTAVSQAIGTKLSDAAQFRPETDQPGGFVRSVTIFDGDRRTSLGVDAFRRAIGLRLGWNTVLSPTFTIERSGSKFIFRGRGFGSQVGLCEAGAFAQARAGRGYRQILKYYYPQAEFGELTHD
ncbi:MAG TPA: SpoIID/LytB domain-containing protein [Blastocatellia bacterium]|nr:SpoIID/LytB domain-containing protein [Blastocatellia bacterium]